MRVAVLVEQLLNAVPGGTGRYSAELASALRDTAAVGDFVDPWVAAHRAVSGARLPGLPSPRRLPLPRRALTAAWSHAHGPVPPGDVIHAPTLLFPPHARQALVVTIHDAVPWTHPETLTPRGVRWHRAMAARAFAQAEVITTPTTAVLEQLSDLFSGSPGARLEVLGAGVSASLRDVPSAQRFRETTERLRLPARFVLSLATLEPRKGLDVLLDALAILGSAAPTLVIVGQSGWGGIDPMADAMKRGLDRRRVLALGRIDDADLAVVLRAADAVIMPSRAEGFGLPIAEAMTVGTPVIASNVPALLEVAGGAALMVPVGDASALAEAIDAVGAGDALRAQLSAAGLVRAVSFSWEVVAKRAWGIYREIA